MAVGVLFFMASLVGAGADPVAADDGDLERRIAEFWQRIDSLQPTDLVSATDLGQWAQNVIARDARAQLTVADFRLATAAMQAAIERAGPAGGGAQPSPAPTPTPGPGAIIAKVGTPVTYTDGWQLTVVRTEADVASRLQFPKPGMEFLAVIVRYQNGTSEEQSFRTYHWEVQDSAGVRRGPTFFLGRADDLGSGDLAPGGHVQGSVIFEVPEGDNRLSVIYDDFGYKVATWELY